MLAFLSAISLFLTMSTTGLAWGGNGGGP